MNLEQAKIALEKINRLFNNMSAGSNSISAIEKDLMLNYVRDFYDQLIDSTEAVKPTQKVKKITPKPVPPPPPPPPVVEQHPVVEEIIHIEEESDPVYAKSKAMETTSKVEENARKAAEIMKSKGMYISDNPAPARIAAKPKPVKKKPPVVIPEKAVDKVEALFAFKRAQELSEKLSELPIRDLSTALGLNEKIFTINELFGSNKDVYDRTVSAINNMNNFDEAKAYLIQNIVSTYDWTNGEKKKKAKIFIKLVRRRFS